MSDESPGHLPVAPPLRPGWYDDPTRRFDHRYHNGFHWTNDVSRDGHRYVDPFHAAEPTPVAPARPEPKNPLATAAMVLGICSICLSWIPLVVVVGAILAILALAFGGVGLSRARARDTDRSRAIVGLVTGGLGLALVAVGIALTVVVLQAVDDFENPAAHEVTITECTTIPTGAGDALTWRAVGEITNVDDEDAEFTVEVIVSEGGLPRFRQREETDRLEAGESATFEFTGSDSISFDPECDVDVDGPLAFGVDLGG